MALMGRPMILILGPTACGKTRIAALAAASLGGEIISADSRQVYRGMDIGTGKDLADYVVDGVEIKAHLVDVADAGEKYSIFDYKRDFDKALADINSRGKVPVVCGGSGMYLETALGLYNLKEAKPDAHLRASLEKLTNQQLVDKLLSLRSVHNTTDILDRERLIRAIEIATAENSYADQNESTGNLLQSSGSKRDSYDNQPVTNYIYGINTPREIVRARITSRLERRLNEGMIDEVQTLIRNGVPYETLHYYGLEYKYVSMYLQGELSYTEMIRLLNTAIHQFAKRQMTWFRRMEKRGINITWIDAGKAVEMIVTQFDQ
ncbi:MAG TPA: tRNA (adenosine(37)-N6)-dimethylallyltransferase MiaA [Lentimicrobium sp.]|nr:tRNA (adenosine(37)-N6)-dimethylallyltransferase MiaA [Lentimicrobium sp.]